jgi:hypothetical protein
MNQKRFLYFRKPQIGLLKIRTIIPVCRLPMQFRTDAENLKKMDSIVVPKDLRRS